MAATLRTIAEECRLDLSTVSRALRGDPRVQPSTAEKVRAAALRQGYRPNLAARALQAGSTRTVWCLVCSFDAVNERHLVMAAGEVVEAAGYDLLVACHRDEPSTYQRMLGRLDQGLADAALVIPGNRVYVDNPAIRSLIDRHYPLVFLDRSSGYAGDPTVTTDNDAAVRALVRRLAASGARRIAVFEESINDVTIARRDGALDEAARLGLPCRLMPDDAWLTQERTPLGIFATSQSRVHDCCTRHAAALRGLDLSIAVFDVWTGEPHPAGVVYVAIQDFAGMARQAARRVLAACADAGAWSDAIDRLPIAEIREVRAVF